MASTRKKTPEAPTSASDAPAPAPGALAGPGEPAPSPPAVGAQGGAATGKDEGNTEGGSAGDAGSLSSPIVPPEGTKEEKQEGNPPSDSPAPTTPGAASEAPATPGAAPSKAPTTPAAAPLEAPATPQAAPEGNDVVLRAEHEALLADLEERDAQIAQLQEENTSLRAANADLQAQVQEVHEVLAATRHEHTGALEALKALERASEEPKTRGPALQARELGRASPKASPPPLPPGHVRIRVKRGSVVLSVGTRREADGVFDIPAWEVAGLDDVIEILARG